MKSWNLSVVAINGYQQYISPYKGFCCAFRIDTGGLSCSEFAKQNIIEHGFFHSVKPILAQFSTCKDSAEKLRKDRNQEKKKSGNCTDNIYACFPCSCGDTGVAATTETIGSSALEACACSPF